MWNQAQIEWQVGQKVQWEKERNFENKNVRYKKKKYFQVEKWEVPSFWNCAIDEILPDIWIKNLDLGLQNSWKFEISELFWLSDLNCAELLMMHKLHLTLR